MHLQSLFCATELFQNWAFRLKHDSSVFQLTCRAVWCRSLRHGFSGCYLAAAKEPAVLASIRKLAYSKEKFPSSCGCQGRGGCQERGGDALADIAQLKLLVPWPGRGDTVCGMIFPARRVLLAKGRCARWCVFTAGLNAQVSPFTPGQWHTRSFPLVLDQFSPCVSSGGADLIQEDGTFLPGSEQPRNLSLVDRLSVDLGPCKYNGRANGSCFAMTASPPATEKEL